LISLFVINTRNSEQLLTGPLGFEAHKKRRKEDPSGTRTTVYGRCSRLMGNRLANRPEAKLPWRQLSYWLFRQTLS